MSRATLLTIHWADDLPDTEIARLSRAWAATISGKPVVTSVRIQVPAPPATRGRGRPPLEQRRYRLARSAVARHDINFVRYTIGVRSRDDDRWCYGCTATIAAGEPHARDGAGGRVCMACIEAAIPEPE